MTFDEKQSVTFYIALSPFYLPLFLEERIETGQQHCLSDCPKKKEKMDSVQVFNSIRRVLLNQLIKRGVGGG